MITAVEVEIDIEGPFCGPCYHLHQDGDWCTLYGEPLKFAQVPYPWSYWVIEARLPWAKGSKGPKRCERCLRAAPQDFRSPHRITTEPLFPAPRQIVLQEEIELSQFVDTKEVKGSVRFEYEPDHDMLPDLRVDYRGSGSKKWSNLGWIGTGLSFEPIHRSHRTTMLAWLNDVQNHVVNVLDSEVDSLHEKLEKATKKKRSAK